MKNWDHSIHQHVVVYQGKELELFCFIFVEVIKKFMGSVFLGGHPVIMNNKKQKQTKNYAASYHINQCFIGALTNEKLTGIRVIWHINLCRLFNAKYTFIQIINSISNNSIYQKLFYFNLLSLVKQF